MNENQNKFLEWLRNENSQSKESFEYNMADLAMSNLASEKILDEYNKLSDFEFWGIMMMFSKEVLNKYKFCAYCEKETIGSCAECNHTTCSNCMSFEDTTVCNDCYNSKLGEKYFIEELRE